MKSRTIDELRGVSIGLTQAAESAPVKLWLKELKRIADDRLESDYTAKGEEAVRGLGFQQAIGVCIGLAEIYGYTLVQAEKNSQTELKNKLKL